MDAVFTRKKIIIYYLLMMFCGIFFAVLSFLASSSDTEAAGGENLGLLITGIIMCIFPMIGLFFNRKASLHVGEGFVRGRYHLFGKIDCSFNEIAFASFQFGTLMILLKNGKRHVITGIENTWVLTSLIRKEIFAVETESPENLKQQLQEIWTAQKKENFWLLGTLVLLFANIFIAVFLTGGRELYEFGKADWTYFSIMGIAEFFTLIVLLYLIQRLSKHNLPVEYLKYRLRGALIRSYPMPSNRVVDVYTGENYGGRIVLCDFPNDEGIFYHVQEFDGNYMTGDHQLKTTFTSEIFKNKEELPENGFSTLFRLG